MIMPPPHYQIVKSIPIVIVYKRARDPIFGGLRFGYSFVVK